MAYQKVKSGGVVYAPDGWNMNINSLVMTAFDIETFYCVSLVGGCPMDKCYVEWGFFAVK